MLSVVLGLSFGVPGLLGFMALAGVPILIHLLHRQRHKTMDWAAMRWLMAALKKNQRWIRLEQWLLLALRTLLIVLTVLAMMKPALEQAKGFFAVLGPSTHHILVLDNSLSMQYVEGNVTRFDRAKEMATAILDSARQGDVASVIVLGTSAHVLVGEPSPYLSSVMEEIDGLVPEDGATRIEQMVEPLSKLLRLSESSRARVYLITDMQRSTWLGEGESNDPAELRRRLVELSGEAPVTILDTSGPESPNLAVTELVGLEPVAVVGRPFPVRATVNNAGSVDRSDVRIDLSVDGEVEASEVVAIPAGQSKSVSFAPTMTTPGDRTIEVRLSTDSLLVDNSRFLIARVRPSLSVLLVDGEPSSEPFRSETDYLRVALSPALENRSEEGLIRTEVKRESDLLDINLDPFDVLALVNVGRLTEPEGQALTAFVRRGGGLVVFAGNKVDGEAYNALLGAGGTKLLPVALGSVVGEPAPAGAGHVFDPQGYAHPLVADFQGNEQAGLVTTKTFRYVKVDLPGSATTGEIEGASRLVEVPLRYDTGDPALVMSPFGSGVVAVVTTSADLDWNSWAISPSYLPVMQQLVRLLSAGRVRRAEVRVGETMSLALPEGTGDQEILVERPSRAAARTEEESPRQLAIKPERQSGVTTLSFSMTDRIGRYTCALGPPADEVWSVAVNGWPAESDLSKIGADELAGTFTGWKYQLLDRVESDQPMRDVSAAGTESIHRGLLYGVLALALLEPILAWRFSRTG